MVRSRVKRAIVEGYSLATSIAGYLTCLLLFVHEMVSRFELGSDFQARRNRPDCLLTTAALDKVDSIVIESSASTSSLIDSILSYLVFRLLSFRITNHPKYPRHFPWNLRLPYIC